MILNTCLECGRVFEDNSERDFCNRYCSKKHAAKIRQESKGTAVEEIGRNTVLSFFEDVVL